jgi:hypothetical protein
VRNREDDMAVGNGQQVAGLSRQPFVAGAGLTLGTVARPAGVKRDGLVRAGITLLDVRPQSGGAACADVPECPPLLPGQSMSPCGEEFLFVLAKDIGDFQPMFGHGRRVSCSSARGESGSASNGL